jgi:hypothetical protein
VIAALTRAGIVTPSAALPVVGGIDDQGEATDSEKRPQAAVESK